MKKILIVLLTMVLLLAGCGKNGASSPQSPSDESVADRQKPPSSQTGSIPKPKYHLKIMRFPEVIPSRRDGRNLRSILLIRRFST